MSRHYLPRMLKRGWGRVVFVSSESAVNIPKEMLDYGMTKTAQLAVSRGLAEAVAGTGVTVNAVLPGPTRSEILGNFMAQQAEAHGITHDEAGRAGSFEGCPANQPHRAVRDDRRSGQHDRLCLFGAGVGDQRRGAPGRWRRGSVRRIAASGPGDPGRHGTASNKVRTATALFRATRRFGEVESDAQRRALPPRALTHLSEKHGRETDSRRVRVVESGGKLAWRVFGHAGRGSRTPFSVSDVTYCGRLTSLRRSTTRARLVQLRRES